MNRVSNAVSRMRLQIQGRIAKGLTTPEKVEETRKALDMDAGEFCRFQELKSLATASGTLTPDEGQYVFAQLGNTPSVFNGRDAAVKAVLTQMFRELLERSMSHEV